MTDIFYTGNEVSIFAVKRAGTFSRNRTCIFFYNFINNIAKVLSMELHFFLWNAMTLEQVLENAIYMQIDYVLHASGFGM